MLDYVSTRGQAPCLSFAQAALVGLATDGGLYVPSACPLLSAAEIDDMASMDYLETAWRVMFPFVGDSVNSGDLARLLKTAYAGFDRAEVLGFRDLAENLQVLELFHGPTFAFKDVALQFLGKLFDFILSALDRHVTIVGATSGDTGSAAIAAFKNAKRAKIVILHPHERISAVQRRQMTTVQADNVRNIAVEGSFDDCQDLVKAMFNDFAFREDMRLSAVNSINWARILAQVVYYIQAGARMVKRSGKPVTFCVPTGNFGNAYAAYVAKSMGLPVHKILVATNRNDILHRFFRSGWMARQGVSATISPSMDIEVSSNIERLIFDLFARDGLRTAEVMRHFRETGPFEVDPILRQKMGEVFESGACDDAQTAQVMRDIHRDHGYVVDPHTAIGLGVAREWQARHPGHAVISLATAHPAKFPDAVEAAIGRKPDAPPALAAVMQGPERFAVLTASLEKIKDFIRREAGA